jgi:hypothetical protein
MKNGRYEPVEQNCKSHMKDYSKPVEKKSIRHHISSWTKLKREPVHYCCYRKIKIKVQTVQVEE